MVACAYVAACAGDKLGRAIERAELPADIAVMAKETEPPKLFWLTYRHSDGRAAGVVVIESSGLLHARLKASLAGAVRQARGKARSRRALNVRRDGRHSSLC
jgi:hypothetical protein